MEKARYNAKTCYKLIDEEQQEITQQRQILAKQQHFYEDLYKADRDVVFTLTNNYGIVVPNDIRQEQDLQLTITQLEEAIKTMKNNKTPGEDGIPVDFYKVFWPKMKQVFYDMVLEVYEEKSLHPSARKGILNLIPKPNKDSRYIKNLRPITLLNTDYKIIEKAIANKMIPALEHVIHHDQRGFMKDRRISVNIRKMLDILHQAEKDDLEAIVLSLDFVKCFDKCSFSILHGSLNFFQFGKIVKDWTKILYDNFTVRVQNNGYFSSSLEIEKGVHQGGCCSSVYFLVIAEILALSLRNNQDIEGITIKEIRNLLNQFADDMDIFSKATDKSLRSIYKELENFRSQSGFTVSYDKTTMYRIGSLRHSNVEMYSMDQYAWSNSDITVLGVTVTHEDILSKNYGSIVLKARKILNAWFNRNLSLLGKVQVVNTLIGSLFVYKMMVLPTIPISIVKSINNMIREFLWNNKKAKIAYNILQNTKQEGGLNLTNLQWKDIALKATWPQILEKEKDYSELVYTVMRVTTIKEDIWRCSLRSDDVDDLNIKNQFWIDVLKGWCQYNFYNNYREDNQIIWYNSRIKINKKVFMWADAYRKGLKYIHQLFNKQEFKSFQEIYEQFGLSKLRYNSLKSAIPVETRKFFSEHFTSEYFPLAPHNYDTAIVTGCKLSRKVYRFLSDDVMILHNKYMKWRIELGESLCDTILEFGKLHHNIFSITNMAKYRSFQYRLLQRSLVTNIQLHQWQIISSNLCSFCNLMKETVVHLLTQCDIVKELWQYVAAMLEKEYGFQNVKVNTKNILLNNIVEQKNSVANFICLVTKQYIYRQRCLKQDPNPIQLKRHNKNTENIEKYIALKNSTLSKHIRKWQPVNCQYNQVSVSINEYVIDYLDKS